MVHVVVNADGPAPDFGVNEDDPVMDNVSNVPEEFVNKEENPDSIDGSRKSIVERFRSSGAKVFMRVAGMTPAAAEYWMVSIERTLYDLDCTPEQKLKGIVSLSRDEAYC
ncbi:esterase-like [Gossypium australe]|uniref:Esterase-like n=1 Tax=Gossypium australe TaxID=47621 RepID=A0A5B6VW04_9ROSI|nr:esterase-like [Gossypium australe]